MWPSIVDRCLEPCIIISSGSCVFWIIPTKCSSLNANENKYYTWSRYWRNCVNMYTVQCRVVVDNKFEFHQTTTRNHTLSCAHKWCMLSLIRNVSHSRNGIEENNCATKKSLWHVPFFFVLYCLARNVDQIYLWAGSTDLNASTKIRSDNVLPASSHFCIKTNVVHTIRLCTRNIFTSGNKHKIFWQKSPVDMFQESCLIIQYLGVFNGDIWNWTCNLFDCNQWIILFECFTKLHSMLAGTNPTTWSAFQMLSYIFRNCPPRARQIRCTKLCWLLNRSSKNLCKKTFIIGFLDFWMFHKQTNSHSKLVFYSLENSSRHELSPPCVSSNMFMKLQTINKKRVACNIASSHDDLHTMTSPSSCVDLNSQTVSLNIVLQRKSISLEFSSTTTVQSDQLLFQHFFAYKVGTCSIHPLLNMDRSITTFGPIQTFITLCFTDCSSITIFFLNQTLSNFFSVFNVPNRELSCSQPTHSIHLLRNIWHHLLDSDPTLLWVYESFVHPYRKIFQRKMSSSTLLELCKKNRSLRSSLSPLAWLKMQLNLNIVHLIVVFPETYKIVLRVWCHRPSISN